jgi:hypothetical protein
MGLVPKSQMHGWAPYTWLAYFGFFYIDPIVSHAGWKVWTWTAIGTLLFLVLYFGFFWLNEKWQRVDIAALILLGIAYSGYNGGAACFFTFAAAFMPFVFHKERDAALSLLIFPAIALTRWYFWDANPWALIYLGLLPMVVRETAPGQRRNRASGEGGGAGTHCARSA